MGYICAYRAGEFEFVIFREIEGLYNIVWEHVSQNCRVLSLFVIVKYIPINSSLFAQHFNMNFPHKDGP